MVKQHIGIMIGDEWSWPPAFVHEIHRRSSSVTVETVQLAGTRLAQPCHYDLIIDRIRYDVPYYRAFLKTALLAGTTVINNPLVMSARDRFSNASLVARLGYRYPRTVALPAASYHEKIADEVLNNLQTAIPWEEHISYLGGFPLVFCPLHERGLRRVYMLETLEELLSSYEETGTETMLLREHIVWQKYVRCLCIGPDHILPTRYNPAPSWSARSQYYESTGYLNAEERHMVIESARQINHALGYAINAIDFAFTDAGMYVLDVTNPVPDFDVNALTPHFFDWVVKRTADYALELLRAPRLPFELLDGVGPLRAPL